MPSNGRREIGVGMVGYAFMGAAHSQAWRTVARAFDAPLVPRMAALCGRDAVKVGAAAQRLGWAATETDWRRLVARDDVALVDVASPGATHAEIAIAALRAGKHVLCEKPLANTVAEARAMAREAELAARRGVRAMVGFNYRRVPALALARQTIASGALGAIRHVRATYLQDWLVDPNAPVTWRLDAREAGSGALGDLAAHVVDLTQHLLGEMITGVGALAETFVTERPVEPGSENRATVTVDDAVVFLARFSRGALATFEATRVAPGRKNALRLEINGARGSLAFDLETLNELQYYSADDPATLSGFRRILVTEPEHPYLAGWWPPGHLLGYEHTFTHEVLDLLGAIARDEQPEPSFSDGLRVQLVLDAVARSAASNAAWTRIDSVETSPSTPTGKTPSL